MKNIKCFSSIELSDPYIDYNNVKSDVNLKKLNGDESLFEIKIKYKDEINKDHLPILRIAFTIDIILSGCSYESFVIDSSTLINKPGGEMVRMPFNLIN